MKPVLLLLLLTISAFSLDIHDIYISPGIHVGYSIKKGFCIGPKISLGIAATPRAEYAHAINFTAGFLHLKSDTHTHREYYLEVQNLLLFNVNSYIPEMYTGAGVGVSFLRGFDSRRVYKRPRLSLFGGRAPGFSIAKTVAVPESLDFPGVAVTGYLVTPLHPGFPWEFNWD